MSKSGYDRHLSMGDSGDESSPEQRIRALEEALDAQAARADAASINAEQSCAQVEHKYLLVLELNSRLEKDKRDLVQQVSERNDKLDAAKIEIEVLKSRLVRYEGFRFHC